MSYACGTCGNTTIRIRAQLPTLASNENATTALPGWEIRCGKGHIWIPIPGVTYTIHGRSA